MKNATLSFVLFLFISTLLPGQGLNRQYALGHTSIAGGIATGPDGQYLVAGYYGDYSVFPLAIAYEAASDEYVTIQLSEYLENPYDELIGISNVVYDPVGAQYYLALSRSGCDYGLPQQLVKIDANDLSVDAIELPQGFYGGHYQLALAQGEGVLLASSYSEEILLFRNNQFYDLFTVENGQAVELENWSQNRFFILSDQSLVVAQLDLVSNTAEVTTTTDIIDGVAVSSLNEEELLVLRSDKLEVRNASLEVEQEIAFIAPTQLVIDDNYIYVVAADGIHFLDHDLNEVSLIPVAELVDHRVLAAASYNGQLVLTGSYQVASNYNDYSFIKLPADLFIRSFGVAGVELPADTDLAITEITHSPVEANLVSYNCMWAHIRDIAVTLRNEGSSTIEEATVTLNIEGCGEPVICANWTARSWKETINLDPGETITLQLGDVTTNIDTVNNFGLCLRVFPNGETMETNIVNNYSCATPIMVVDAEEVAAPIDFSVYPTICYDKLILSFPNNSGNFDQAVIYNMLGQPILKHALPVGQMSIPVDVSQLAAGSYFICLEGKKRSQMVTFVKS